MFWGFGFRGGGGFWGLGFFWVSGCLKVSDVCRLGLEGFSGAGLGALGFRVYRDRYGSYRLGVALTSKL